MQKPSRGFLGRANVPEFEENFEKIDSFRTHKYRQFGEKDIDLSSALTDEEIEIEANGIFIKYPVSADIRINDLDAPKISALQFRYIGGYVHKIYVTSPIQNPKLKLLTGVNSEVGFMSNNHIIGDEITGTSSATLTAFLRWYCLNYTGKTITIKNTGTTNNLGYVLDAYVNGRIAKNLEVDAAGGIAPGATKQIEVSGTYDELILAIVQITASTTFRINYNGVSEFSVPDFTAKEDEVHVSGDYGVPSLAVRKNTNGALSADGDYTPIQVNTTGYIKVYDDQLYYLSRVEDSIHYSTDKGIMCLAVRKDAATNLVSADGDYASLEVDANGRLHTEPNDIGTGVGAEDTTVGTTSGTFGAQAFKKGCMIVVNAMGSTNTWIEIRIGSGKVRCTAVGQGIDWIPIANASEITVIGDGADDGIVSYTGV